MAGRWESLWAGATRFCDGRAGWNQEMVASGGVHPRLSMLLVHGPGCRGTSPPPICVLAAWWATMGVQEPS